MTSWNINDGTNDFDVYDVKVTRQLSGLNYAEMNVVCDDTTKPIIGAASTLTFGATTVFVGYVNELKKKTYGEYTLKLTEIANDLKYFYVHTGTIPSESRVVIVDNSSGSPLAFGDYIDTILNGTEWTDGSDSTYRNATTNPITNAIFDDVMFNNMTVYDALVQMIETTCGYYCWFNNSAKTVHYGPKDTLVTGRTNHGDLSASIIETYSEDSNVNHNVDRIIVVSTVNTSDGAEYEGGYPTTGLPTYPKTLIYQYEDVVSDGQATTIAQQIYNERNSIRERFELKLLPDLLSINEGDIVSYDSVSYSVIDVTIADSDVTVGLKYFKESIFDRLGDKIKLVSGASLVGTDATFDCSPQNVPETDNSASTVMSWTWQIDDVANIGSEVYATPHIEQYKAQSYQSEFGVTNQLLSVISPVWTSYTQSTTVPVTSVWTYYPDSTGVKFSAPSFGGMGYDYALISVTVPIFYESSSSLNTFETILQYSFDRSTWIDSSRIVVSLDAERQIYSFDGVDTQTGKLVVYYDPFGDELALTDDYDFVTNVYYNSFYVTSSETATIVGIAGGYAGDHVIYLRLYSRKIGDYGYMFIGSARLNVNYKARHTHAIQQYGLEDEDTLIAEQTDSVKNSGTPPSTCYIKINGDPGVTSGWTALTDDTQSTTNLKSSLISGQNYIYIKAYSECNIGLTLNYQAYGSGV